MPRCRIMQAEALLTPRLHRGPERGRAYFRVPLICVIFPDRFQDIGCDPMDFGGVVPQPVAEGGVLQAVKSLLDPFRGLILVKTSYRSAARP
jgi:hypothetical protein